MVPESLPVHGTCKTDKERRLTSRKAQHLGHDLLELCCGEELVEVMDWPGKRITQSAAIAFTRPARASQKSAKHDSERDCSASERLIGGLPDMHYLF